MSRQIPRPINRDYSGEGPWKYHDYCNTPYKTSPSFADDFQWQNVEKAGRDAIEEKKIRVVFLPADGTATTPNHKQVNGLVCLTLQQNPSVAYTI